MTRQGSIPDEIYLVTQEYKNEDGYQKSCPATQSTLSTAKQWAVSYPNRDGKYTEEKLINTPKSGFKIIDLSVRGNGGRAYRVVWENKVFNLRKDVLMEVIEYYGIKAGGKLGGEFVKRLRRPIQKKDLVVGHVYENLKGEEYVYGGLVDCVEIDYEKGRYETMLKKKSGQLWLHVYNFSLPKSLSNYPYVLKEKKVYVDKGPNDLTDDLIQYIIDTNIEEMKKDDWRTLSYAICTLIAKKGQKIILLSEVEKLINNYDRHYIAQIKDLINQ